jgi:tyrosyl-tRNA synthetase
MKMSKSDPQSAIFVHDGPDEIQAKLRRAFCPPESVDFNPVLDWIDKLVFRIVGGPLHVERAAQNGGPVTFETYDQVRETYAAGRLHPMDAKQALAVRLIDILEPARAHFAKPEVHAMLEDLDRLTAA